jgi:3-oxoacid CoA-transferase subunit B
MRSSRRGEINELRFLSLIFTNLAVIEVTPAGLILQESAPGFTPDEIQAVTEPPLIIAKDLKEIEL